MTTTTTYGITLLEASQAQKEVTINEAFALIDTVLKGVVLDKDLSTPPAMPATGDAYIVAASATGAWAGKEAAIAYYDQVWRFITPPEHMRIWVADEEHIYAFDGTAWQISNPSITSISGNAATATALQTPRTINGVAFDGTANIAISNISGNAATATALQTPRTINGIAFDGTANIAINNISGNAGTATALQTPRTINGVAFDGTANISISAAADASTLTGTALAAGVTGSSLTSVGTLATGVWNATPIAAPYGGVPTGGATNQVLAKNSATNYDYAWVTPSSGGGSVAGADTQIQFNDGGVMGAEADLTWNKATNTLGLVGTDTGLTLAAITTEPSTPPASTLRLYAKSIAGKVTLKAKGPSGLDYPYQTAFWQNNIAMWTPTNVTAGVWLGTVGAGAGTYTTALPTTTNVYTSMKRGRWANIATTSNQVLGQRNTEAMYFIGNNVGQGGFFFYARLGFDMWTNGGRFFAGFATATTVISADPSSLNNTVGFCVDLSDNGAISFLTRSTTATKQSTGLTISSNKGYDCFIFCKPNDNTIGYRIVELNSGAEYSNTTTATTPAVNTMLTANVLASNAVLTGATAIQLGLNRIYVETDY